MNRFALRGGRGEVTIPRCNRYRVPLSLSLAGAPARPPVGGTL